MNTLIPIIVIALLLILSFIWTRYRRSLWFLILNFIILAVFANDISQTPENYHADIFLIILTVFNVYRYFRDRNQ